MRNDPDFIGVYGNFETWRVMQRECDRYGDHKRQMARYKRAMSAIKKLEEKTNGTETTDPG